MAGFRVPVSSGVSTNAPFFHPHCIFILIPGGAARPPAFRRKRDPGKTDLLTRHSQPAKASPMTRIHIIGGGLAGSEAAWGLAEAGLDVVLHEMRPIRGTFAHQTDGLAELVCSNSFRSDDAMNNAVGLLHEEMRRAGSLIMRMADRHKLPAGGALAVDREGFSQAVTAALAPIRASRWRAKRSPNCRLPIGAR